MLEGQVYHLFALYMVFSGAKHIYQPQNECSIQDCETILRDIRKDIVELKHSVGQLQSIKESEPVNNVAFNAQLAKSVTDDYVIFSHVITNEGTCTAYDKSSGIFTCQLCGTYVFSWTIASSQHHQTTADLLVNEVSVGSTATYPRGSERVSKGSSTGFVVYNLKVGDKVRVILNRTAIGNFSTFSGWKLQHANSRPLFMASSEPPAPSSPVDFTREYIDQTDSLLGSEFQTSKSGVYLIFWNTIDKEMVVTTLLVNDKEAGRAVTSKSQHSYEDNVSISGYFLF